MEEAINKMEEKNLTQPAVFRCHGHYYIKADSTAIALGNCCLAEAVEYCFMSFFVFGVHYPWELRTFYIFMEHIVDMKARSKSVVVLDLLRTLHKL